MSLPSCISTMKGMLVVIALFADSMKAGDEVGFGERRLFGDRDWFTIVISMPS